MTPIPEETYRELEGLFDTLKRTSQKPNVTMKEATGAKSSLDEHFLILQKRLDEITSSTDVIIDDEDLVRLAAMKASLFYEDAKIKLTTESFEESRGKLEAALGIADAYQSSPFIVYLRLRIVNHFAFALSKLGAFEKASLLLKEVCAKEYPTDVVIYSTEELFSIGGIKKVDATQKLHSIHINNLQMLSWVYSKMGQEYESALMQHKILEKELDHEECDPVDWAIRCNRVASLYLVKLQFPPARYYLSASTSALERVEAALIDHPYLGKAQAELARGWIYYGLRLFDTSKSRDIHKLCSKIFEDNQTPKETNKEKNSDGKSSEANVEEEFSEESFKFPNSEVKVANVPAKLIANAPEARLLFHHTQMWLKRARVYYTLRDHPFIYVNCVLDLSELYRFLAFYESDLDIQYSVQKRRADALETLSTILKEVRPQCYIAVSVELLRELAEVQVELMGINLKKMYKMHDPSENEEALKHRIDSVYNIQTKLEKVGNMFGKTSGDYNLLADGNPSTSPVMRNNAQDASNLDENQVNPL